jgi:lysophospholipase L1-like esterase
VWLLTWVKQLAGLPARGSEAEGSDKGTIVSLPSQLISCPWGLFFSFIFKSTDRDPFQSHLVYHFEPSSIIYSPQFAMLLSTAGLVALQIISTTALQMASLGSSYAAGPGLSENYPHIVASKIGANLTDVSVSGSLLKDIASQIAGIPSNADIVTITSGGNDLSYVSGLSKNIAPAQTVSQEELTTRFTTALSSIHSMAPNATIYLVEYLTMLGPSTTPNTDVPFNATEIQAFEAIFSTLKAATEAAKQDRKWVVVVPVSSTSMGHALGSDEEVWVNGQSVPEGAGGRPWHPNTKGTEAVAEMVVGKISRPEECE